VLESADLSAAQQRDPIYYEPGQIIDSIGSAKRAASGAATIGSHPTGGPSRFCCQDGKERQLPLHLAQDFNVYRAQSMPVAVGERVLITKNNRKASLTNGDLLEVKAIEPNRDLAGKRAPTGALQAAAYPTGLHHHFPNFSRPRAGQDVRLSARQRDQPD